jgi:hypothetical protein
MTIESNPHWLEKERGMEKIHTFFDIDTEAEEKLLQEIERSEGLIRVFVHPGFKEYSTFLGIKNDQKQVDQLLEAQEVFERVITSKSEHVPPIFVFEGGFSADEFQKKEGALAEISAKDIYIIRTEGANPNPLPPDHQGGIGLFEHKKIPEADRAEMWEWVIEEFKKWGVKKILIGGAEFYISKEEASVYGGCVGAAINKLQGNFIINISSMTWPEKIRTFKK